MAQHTELRQLTSRLLLVEDDLTEAQKIIQYFQNLNYEVQHFRTGENAIVHLDLIQGLEKNDEQAVGYDAILLDMDLQQGGGKLDGIETAKWMDNLHLYIPILLMTAFPDTFQDRAGRQTPHWVMGKSSLKNLAFSLKNLLAEQNPRCIIRPNGMSRLVLVNQIICIESVKNVGVKVYLIESKLLNGQIQYSYQSYTKGKQLLGDFYEQIGSPIQFERIHKEHLVNRDYLIGFDKKGNEPYFYFKGLNIAKKGSRKRGILSDTIRATIRLKDYWLEISNP